MMERISIQTIWRGFMENASEGAWRLVGSVRPSRLVRLTEIEPGRFAEAGALVDVSDPKCAQDRFKGAELEVVLHPSRILWRRVRLPAQARDFIGGIAAGQADRLLPWPHGAFHHGACIVSEDADGLDVALAGAGNGDISAVRDGFMVFAPGRLRLVAAEPAMEVTLYNSDEPGRSRHRLARGMQFALLASLLVSSVSAVSIEFAMRDVSVAQAELGRRQNALRGLSANQNVTPDADARARKAEDRSVTLALESLAALVPDDTYLMSLDMSAGRIVASGQSRDANALVGILERSGYFSEARFVAPTVRDGSGAERFQIEAKIAPQRAPR